MDVDILSVRKIIGNNKRFISPDNEPYAYYIWTSGEDESVIDESKITLYLQKLQYAVDNVDALVNTVFQEEFYHFYGIDKDAVKSPEQMSSELIFESFVLSVDDNVIGAYLSNERFMYGHFIDCQWDMQWNLLYSWID